MSKSILIELVRNKTLNIAELDEGQNLLHHQCCSDMLQILIMLYHLHIS